MRKCMKRTGGGSEIQERSGGRERQHKGKAAGHRSGVEATVVSQSCSCSILRANSSEIHVIYVYFQNVTYKS